MSRIRKGYSINASSFTDWRWIPYFLFLSFFNALYSDPLGWVREVKISVVGFLKKDDILRSKPFSTKLYFPMLTPIVSLEEHLKDKGFSMRVAFFTWTTSSEKVLTLDNLSKNHIVVML
jgi:hypothetical protein